MLFSAIRSLDNETFAEDGLTGFQASKVLYTRTITTTVLNIFQNNITLFMYE